MCCMESSITGSESVRDFIEQPHTNVIKILANRGDGLDFACDEAHDSRLPVSSAIA